MKIKTTFDKVSFDIYFGKIRYINEFLKDTSDDRKYLFFFNAKRSVQNTYCRSSQNQGGGGAIY